MEISCLPNEILEIIFGFLDGASLTRGLSTCRLWYELIANLQSSVACWKNICLREIDNEIILHVLENKPLDREYGADFWRKIYIKFYLPRPTECCPFIDSTSLPDRIGMEISCLPIEILEKIFGFLDGASLIRSRATCHLWNELVTHLQSSDINASWKNLCLREFDNDIAQELLIDKPLDREYGIEFWKKVYIKIHRLRCFQRYPCLVRKLPLPESGYRITRVKVSGNCLITGNACGNVWLWDTTFGEVVQPLCKHKKAVTDIVLVDLFNLGCYKAIGCITAHHHVITSSKDRTLKVVPLQLSNDGVEFVNQSINMPGPVDCLRIFDNVLMAKDHEGNIFIWKMSVAAPSSTVMELIVISVPRDDLPIDSWWTGLWKDEISVITKNMDRYTFSIKEKLWTSLSAPTLEPVTKNGHHSLENVIIKVCFLFHENTIVFLTVDNYLGISVDGHRYIAYSTLASLKSYVTSVKVFCNLFILGTSIGGIYMYLYQKKEELLNLNLHEPLWSKGFSNSAIISIDMWLNWKKIVMATVTDDTIYVVQWIPKSHHLPLV